MNRDEIARLLPEVFQRTITQGSPLEALLAIMEALPAPAEAVLANLEDYFDPYQAPDAFAAYLAGWVDLDRLFSQTPDRLVDETAATLFPPGLGRLRELLAAAAYLSHWRGTNRGLIGFLETATGIPGFTIEESPPGEDGQPRPFHILVQAPGETAVYQPLLERIIEAEKPVYVTYDLAFGQ